MEPPVVRLAEEHERLYRLPRLSHTLCSRETRKVNWQSVSSVGGARHSVPYRRSRRCDRRHSLPPSHTTAASGRIR